MSQAPTVRISREAHQSLKQMAEMTGSTLQELLESAVENQRRRLFFEQLEAGYQQLRQDPEAWQEFQKELELWDVTLLDGLEEHERHQPRRRVARRSRTRQRP